MLFSPKEKGQSLAVFGFITALILLCIGAFTLLTTGSFPKGW